MGDMSTKTLYIMLIVEGALKLNLKFPFIRVLFLRNYLGMSYAHLYYGHNSYI